MTIYRYVVALTAAVDVAGTLQTFYVGSTGFTTRPTDTPASTEVPPYLLNPGNYERSLFSGKRAFGAVSANFGEVVIANHAGQYDAWINYSFDGRPFQLWYGPEGAAFPAGYTLVLQCTMLSADFGLDAVRVKLRDRLALLDKPVITQFFAGTGGVEGTADMANKPKPRIFSAPPLIPAVMLDRGLNLYYLHGNAEGAPGSGPQVWDGGVTLTRGSDYSSAADMLANVPAAGQYRALVSGPTYVRLGSKPEYPVFAYAEAPPMSFASAAVEAGITDASGGVGVMAETYISDSSTTWLHVLNSFANPLCQSFGFSRLDEWFCVQFSEPSGSPVWTFNKHNCLSMQRSAPSGAEVPLKRVTADSYRVWIHPPQLAPSADILTARPWAARQYRFSAVSENSVGTQYKLAESMDITSDCQVNVGNTGLYLTLFGTRRDQVTIEALFDPALLTLDLNSVVSVQWPRFGYGAGKLFRVIAQRFDFAANRFQFTLWG